MRRLRSSRKGDLSYMLTRTLDIIWSLLIVAVIALIAFTLWRAIYGTDKQSLNQYVVMGDILEGTIESPATGQESIREFTLSADLSDRDAFEGTILARSSDGRWTTPIPPAIWYVKEGDTPHTQITTETMNLQEHNPKKAKACGDNACLCFSRTILEEPDQLEKAFNAITECKSYKTPKGKERVIFDFASAQQSGGVEKKILFFRWKEDYYQDGKFPVLTLKKGGCLPAANRHGREYPDETSICIYAAVKPVATS